MHVTTWEFLNGLSWNLILDNSYEELSSHFICASNCVKITHCLNICVNFWVRLLYKLPNIGAKNVSVEICREEWNAHCMSDTFFLMSYGFQNAGSAMRALSNEWRIASGCESKSMHWPRAKKKKKKEKVWLRLEYVKFVFSFNVVLY